jgi:hypothetical protein
MRKNDEMSRLERFLAFCSDHDTFTMISLIAGVFAIIFAVIIGISMYSFYTNSPAYQMQKCLDSELFSRDECVSIIEYQQVGQE